MEIEYTVPLDKLSGGELRSLLEANGFPGGSRRLGRTDLADIARGAGLEGLTLRGRDAIDAKARELLSVVGRLDRVVAFRPGAKLGLELKQVGEWAVVMAAPAAVESKVRLGDVLAAVDGADVLLEPYDDMFRRVVAATRSPVPFTLTFRRAPFHRGWLFKRARAKPGRRSLFSGASGWKKRYFVLATASSRTTTPPLDRARRPGLLFARVVRGPRVPPRGRDARRDGDARAAVRRPRDPQGRRAALKGPDLHNWARLSVALAHANGGSDLLRDEETARQAVARQDRIAREDARVASAGAAERKAGLVAVRARWRRRRRGPARGPRRARGGPRGRGLGAPAAARRGPAAAGAAARRPPRCHGDGASDLEFGDNVQAPRAANAGQEASIHL
ncbi:hypothetical protein JL722_517 [Aureococcus anophagefferens]|nr:hypothetical protein JL722_517 [Aureococcus anophagefferens]